MLLFVPLGLLLAQPPSGGAVIEGTVTSAGRPVADAIIVIASGGKDLAKVRSSPLGTFRIEGRPGAVYSLRVTAAGFLPRSVDTSLQEPVDIVLTPGRVLEGVVRAAGDSRVVGGATVEVFREAPDDWSEETPVATTKTDAAGRFRLELSGRDRLALVVEAPAGRARLSLANVSTPLELRTAPAAKLSGMISGPDRLPARGAVVRLESLDGKHGTVVRADPAGRFELRSGPGTYRLLVVHPQLAARVVPRLTIEGRDSTVDVALSDGFSLSGRLVDEQGQAVAGNVSVVEFDGTSLPDSLSKRLTVKASRNGRFRVGPLGSGRYGVLVWPRGYAARRIETSVVNRGVTLDSISVRRGLAIRGVVKDRDGSTIAGVKVTARLAEAVEGYATTDPDGSFEIGGLRAVRYVLHAASGDGEATLEVDAGGEAVVVLERLGVIHGAVVDERGKPVREFTVGISSGRPGFGRPRSVLVKNVDGLFAFERIRPGRYAVQVAAATHAPASVGDVEVSGESTVDVGLVILKGSLTLDGEVVDSAGNPVEGASVSLLGVAAETAGARGRTDASGAFQLVGVPEGRVDLEARHPEFAEAHRFGVRAGEEPVRIVLSSGGRLLGRLWRRDGTPVPGARVHVQPSLRVSAIRRILWPDADGWFRAERLPPGPLQVSVYLAPGDDRSRDGPMRMLDIEDGKTARVEFQFGKTVVSGRVTRGGRDLPNVRVRLFDGLLPPVYRPSEATEALRGEPQAISYWTAMTSGDGSYALLVEHPGRYEVVVETLDGALQFPRRTAQVPDADAFALDLDFSSSRVAGIVLGEENGEPLSAVRVSLLSKTPVEGRLATIAGLTDRQGQFDLPAADGSYSLTARSAGYVKNETDVEVTGSDVTGLRLILARGDRLEGRVSNSAGRGIPGVRLWAFTDRGPIASAVTDHKGEFSVAGVPAAPVCLVGMTGGDSPGFVLASSVSKSPVPLEFTLTEATQAAVRVEETNGKPVSGAFVQATRIGGIPCAPPVVTRTDASGWATLPLPSGRAVLEITDGRSRLTAETEMPSPKPLTVQLPVR